MLIAHMLIYVAAMRVRMHERICVCICSFFCIIIVFVFVFTVAVAFAFPCCGRCGLTFVFTLAFTRTPECTYAELHVPMCACAHVCRRPG